MKASYETGSLVIYKVEYKNQAGAIRGKPRPLVIISEPNSKGDYLAIAGSTQIHQWLDEEHVLILPDMVLEGSLDKPTIFPASKQILINPKFIRAQIGRIPPQHVERLLRLRFAQHTRTFFRAAHRPKNKAAFIPGKSRIPYAGRVYDEEEMINLVDSALDFWLTAGRFEREFTKKLAGFLGAKHIITTNSGSSANLLAIAALTSHKLGDRRLQPSDEVLTVAAGFPTTVAPIVQHGLVPVFVDIELGTYNVAVEQLEAAISERTKAIFLAHTLGVPFDLDGVMEIVRRHNLWLIEDNCDALGSMYEPADSSLLLALSKDQQLQEANSQGGISWRH